MYHSALRAFLNITASNTAAHNFVVLYMHSHMCLKMVQILFKRNGLRNTTFMTAIFWDVMPCRLVESFNPVIKYWIIF